MGLSNEERAEKIYFSIWRMTQSEKVSRIREEYPPLADLLEKLWPAFLGKYGNSLHWILGSGVSDEVMDKPTLFNVAVCGNFDRERPDSLDSLNEDRRKEIEAILDVAEREAELEKFDLCEFQSSFRPTISGILERNAPGLADVYAVYEDCENIRYALNRYRDDFARSGAELDALVANILGACFHVFTTDSRIREAWYTFQIANRAVYRRIDPCATIVKIWRRGALHQDVGLGVHRLEDLHEYWKKLQCKQTLTTEESVLATLWLLQRRFHYAHQLNDVLVLLRRHNKNHRKDKVNLAKVRKMFKTHNLPAYEQYEERGARTVEFCRLSEQTVARNWKCQPKKRKK